ncbi:hypothetical protein D3C86_1426540 [compost metagenome]
MRDGLLELGDLLEQGEVGEQDERGREHYHAGQQAEDRAADPVRDHQGPQPHGQSQEAAEDVDGDEGEHPGEDGAREEGQGPGGRHEGVHEGGDEALVLPCGVGGDHHGDRPDAGTDEARREASQDVVAQDQDAEHVHPGRNHVNPPVQSRVVDSPWESR